MKNNLEQKLQKATEDPKHGFRLTRAERDSMRRAVDQYMLANPLAVSGATPSPYHFFYMQRAMPFIAVLLLILVSAGGTAFAAEGTLPGDLLYPVKISVNEQVQSALALSPSAKAEVHANLAERRLEEAEALATVGKLDQKTTKVLQSNLSEHAVAAQTISNDIAKTDPVEAAQLSNQLMASLSVNTAVLTDIGDDSADPDTKQDSHALSLAVRSSMTAALDSSQGSSAPKGKGADDQDTGQVATKPGRPTVTAALAPSSTPTSSLQLATTSSSTPPAPAGTSSSSSDTHKNYGKIYEAKGSAISATQAIELRARAAKNLEAVRGQFNDMKSMLSATTTATVELRLQDIQSLMTNGNEALDAKQYPQAFAGYSLSLGASSRLQVILRVVKRVKPSKVQSLFILKGEDGEVLGTTTSSTGANSSSTINTSNKHNNTSPDTRERGDSSSTTSSPLPVLQYENKTQPDATAQQQKPEDTSDKQSEWNVLQSKKESRSLFQKVIHFDLND